MYLYIQSKFSPIFLWVSKFYFKFQIWCQVGGRCQKFQNYSRYVTFLFVGLKVRFWNTRTRCHFDYCGRSFDQASTLSLRGPAQFTHEARSAELEQFSISVLHPKRWCGCGCGMRNSFHILCSDAGAGADNFEWYWCGSWCGCGLILRNEVGVQVVWRVDLKNWVQVPVRVWL